MTELIVKDLTVSAAGAVLVDNVSFCLAPGEFAVLLGPNGAGKTSLLRAAIGLEKTDGGSVTLGDRNFFKSSPIERARQLTYLPQVRSLAWPCLVRDVVALGRYAYGASLGRLGEDDAAAIKHAMAACDIADLAERRTDTLSGGELVRVHCARALAAQTPFLVADEPVASLDPRHQFRILDLIQSYVRGGGAALVVLHDIGLAARYADRMIWMKDGKIIADGAPGDTLTPERIKFVYDVNARVEGSSVTLEGPA